MATAPAIPPCSRWGFALATAGACPGGSALRTGAGSRNARGLGGLVMRKSPVSAVVVCLVTAGLAGVSAVLVGPARAVSSPTTVGLVLNYGFRQRHGRNRHDSSASVIHGSYVNTTAATARTPAPPGWFREVLEKAGTSWINVRTNGHVRWWADSSAAPPPRHGTTSTAPLPSPPVPGPMPPAPTTAHASPCGSTEPGRAA